MSNAYQDYKAPSSGASKFFKFEEGKEARIRIASDGYVFNDVFQRGDEMNVSTKYAWIIYNKDTDQAQILKLPVTAFREVQALATNKEWGDPTGYDLIVKRTGTGLDTHYTITPSTNRASLMTAQEEAVHSMGKLTDYMAGAISLGDAAAGKKPPMPSQDGEGWDMDGLEQLSEKDIPEEYRG